MSATRPLAVRLRERIRAEGPITFADFMEAALYDPHEGFYSAGGEDGSGHPVGKDQHFVTAPHVSPAFGSLLAVFASDVWERLGRPASFPLIEVGAGDGTLAVSMMPELENNAGLREAIRYIGVERAEGPRLALDRAIAGFNGVALESLDDVEAEPRSKDCLLLANELLDNLPFGIVRCSEDGAVAESLVGLEGERFVLIEGRPSSKGVEGIARDLSPGTDGVAPMAALEFVERLPTVVARGYALFIDYAHEQPAHGASPHSYRNQHANADILSDPGSRDITAGVDIAAMATRARASEMFAWGPITQRELLMALGFRGWDSSRRQAQIRALDEHRGMDAARIYSERSAARLLVDPAGLGGFRALCLGIEMTDPPVGFDDG